MKKVLKLILLVVIVAILLFLLVYYYIKMNTDKPYIKSKGVTIIELDTNNVKQDEDLEVTEKIDINQVIIKIKEGTLTKTSMTVIIENNSNQPFGYGEAFYIEKKENGKWTGLRCIDMNYSFNAISYIIPKNGRAEEKIDWSELYGELKVGEYRLIKEQLSIEFVIQ